MPSIDDGVQASRSSTLARGSSERAMRHQLNCALGFSSRWPQAQNVIQLDPVLQESMTIFQTTLFLRSSPSRTTQRDGTREEKVDENSVVGIRTSPRNHSLLVQRLKLDSL